MRRLLAAFLIGFIAAHALAQTTRPTAHLNLPQLKRLAEKGDAAAQTELGRRYLLGKGTQADPTAAMSWFGKAGGAGSGDALFELYLCYRDGAGAEAKNDSRAERLLLASAELKHPRALVALAERDLAAKDRAKADSAMKLLNDLARQGDPTAQLALGKALARGGRSRGGVGAADPIQMILKAASADDERVGLAAARTFRDGEGTLRPDATRATLLFRRLAEKGVREASIDLARLAPDSYRGIAREQSIDRIGKEDRLIGTSVAVEGELVSADEKLWTLRDGPRGEAVSVIPDTAGAKNVEPLRFVRVWGLVESLGVVRGLAVEVPEPKYALTFKLTEPKILKGTYKQKFVVDGEVRNIGKQDMQALTVRIRVFQADSGKEDVMEITLKDVLPGERRPFTAGFKPEDVQAPLNVTPVLAETTVQDVKW